MSDVRFASLKTDPRFRRPKKRHSKVVLDDRFKHLLQDEKKATRAQQRTGAARVDKYGRTVSATREKDDLRRFYRLEEEDGGVGGVAAPTIIDYARGAVLMESSDEEEGEEGASPRVPSEDDSDSDQSGFITLGPEPDAVDEGDLEVDLDENTMAALGAQVAEYATAVPEREVAATEQTKRLAVVNLDWDYVRAVHLFKIFSSLVSPTASLVSASTSHIRKSTGDDGVNVARGRILSVRIYPSEFGKKRMAAEDKEGPPVGLFKRKTGKVENEDINEKTIFETGTEADYDEDALRKYQLERLRYYYAIVECDTVETAAHVYNELEGTELERSANVFDLSFVPDDMTFDDEPRDEAIQLLDTPYRAVEFVTDALRHSKVKLTWDEDDHERNHILRRPLTRKEIDEADFRAYIASSSSSEGESKPESASTRERQTKHNRSKRAERGALRDLLLGGNDDELPEGWGNAFGNKESRVDRGKTDGRGDSDVDMEVTFMPGLSETKNPDDENTLERYRRKLKEKRKRKKEERKKGEVDGDGDSRSNETTRSTIGDEFFGIETDSPYEDAGAPSHKSGKEFAKDQKSTEASKEELALLATYDNPNDPAHFDMKAVIKAERNKNKKRRSKKHHGKDDEDNGPGETQDDFVMDVKDERFAAVHEDHQFAIDPTNPHFKKTKGMAALLDERSKRRKSHSRSDRPAQLHGHLQLNGRSLQSLVESVKRKSAVVDRSEFGKRRKLGKS